MSSRTLAILLLVLGLSLAAFPLGDCVAQPSLELKARVKQLIEQLADPDESKQEAAALQLAKLGPDVLPLLPGAGEKLKPTQAKHLAAIAKMLRETEAAKSLAPKRVTLEVDEISLSKAMAELARQTGIKVEDRRREQNDTKLKLALNKVTFWQALDEIARQADVRVYPYREQLAIVDGPHQELPTSYSGIFRVVIKRLAAYRDLEADSHFSIATLEVAWEPRFRPFLIDTRPQSLVIKDDKDKLLPTDDEGGGKSPIEGPIAMTVEVRLPAPPRSVAKLNLLKGNLRAVLPSKMLEFTFDKLDVVEKVPQAREVTKDGVTVALKPSLEKVVWKLEVSLTYPADGPEFESFQSWLLNNEIYLLKDDGQKLPNNAGYATDAVTKNRATLTYNFIDERKLPRGKAADWKVVYRTPGAIVEVPVPFEFKDLPLP